MKDVSLPPPTTTTTTAGRSKKCFIKSTTQRGCKMDGPDVIIFYSNDASEWSGYLMRCFQDQETSDADHRRRRPLNVRHICMSNLVLPSTMAVMDFYRRAKVQIVILSPEFLDVVPSGNECLGDLFEPARVLALMCGVVEAEVTAEHRARLASYDAWNKMTVVEDDSDFVANLMGAALQLVQSHVAAPVVASNYSKAFHVFPSKVRESNPLVYIHLKKPLHEDRVVSVEFEHQDRSVPIEAKCTNPYTVKIVVPDSFFGCSRYVYVHVKCGSESLGIRPLKCESKMGELNGLLGSLLDPLEFMSQTLGLSTARIEYIDRVLVKSLWKNFPKIGFSIFNFGDDDACRNESCKIPTVLHFAAKFGLQEVSAALLDCPGAATACRIRNSDKLGPIELAETEGHSSLANMIDNFMKLSETEQVYRYMKSVAEGDSSVDYENLRTMFAQSVDNAGYFMSAFVDNDAVERVEISAPIQNEPRPISEVLDNNRLPFGDPEKTMATTVEGLMPFSQSQRELIKMLEDFKRDKTTIEETEALFNNWQQRQKVHSSFKEKQAQLLTMRQRYELMQNKCQQEGKKSVLERFRTMLMRNVKSPTETSVDSKANDVHVRSKGYEQLSEERQHLIGVLNVARPCSNSSCSSSGSSRCSSSLSNRSSTLSAMSISSAADSGAQSDIGEEPSTINVVQHSGSPRQLSKPILPKRIVIRPCNFHSNANPSPSHRYTTTPSPLLPPQKHSPTLGSSLATAMFSSSCRRRNPMPFPRVATSPSSRPVTRKASSASASVPPSPDYITPDPEENGGEGHTPMSLRRRPSITNSDNTPTQSPFGDGYLRMDSATLSHTSPRRRRVSSSSPSSSPRSLADPCRSPRNDPDYCNVIYGPNSGVYMDMNLQQFSGDNSDGKANLPVRSTPLAQPHLVTSNAAATVTRSHVYINAPLAGLAVDCDFSERCDSVPDMPPPAPPTSTLNRSRPVVPPPLPPRNPEIMSRAK